MRIPLPRASGRRQHRQSRHRRGARMRLLAPLAALAVLAGAIVATVGTPQRAEAAVEDYRPATYNMQGGNNGAKWTTDVMQLINSGYNVISLQEAGPNPPASVGAARWTSAYLGGNQQWAGWRIQRYEWDPYPNRINLPWNIYWLRTDFGGNRVNLAIATPYSADSVLLARPAFWGSNGLPTSRPALGIRLNNTIFYSVHALASGGGDGTRLLDNIAAQAGTRMWAAMGDWNREPEDLTIRRGWHKYTSGQATHMGSGTVRRGDPRPADRELDYMVANERIAGYGGVARGFGSDHFAVGFRRLAANADVHLLNAHDGDRTMHFAQPFGGTALVNGTAGDKSRASAMQFVPTGDGFYKIRNSYNGMCWMIATAGQVVLWDCSNVISEQFDINYWNDTGQLAIRPRDRNTCVGDDGGSTGFGSEILYTLNCNAGESRINFRFDYDPGPNAALVAF
ncbi:hypothetical protein [Streptomyces sp. NPDC047061]|uniref:hypothetical protein n=1 Tax=Streptomyces sp. NPDC047061 TaxID=3154605 RepID=UPI0033F58A04